MIQMAIVVLLLLFFIASFCIAWFSGHKFFFVVGFAFLMFTGVLIQSSGGVILDDRPVSVTDAGAISYSDVVVTLEDSGLFLFSQACFWIGLVLLAWTGLVSAFGSGSRVSPFGF